MNYRHFLAIAGLSLGTATQATAFDMPPPIDAPEITTISATSGWYLRGDLGYNAKIKADAPTFRSYNSGTDSYTSNTFDPYRLDGDYSLSTGAGYQFNDFFRSDVTVDYFQADFNSKSSWETPCATPTTKAYISCSYKQQELSSLGLLGNAYVDLGTFWGLTPYVGAGAGASYVQWSNVKQSTRCFYAKKPSNCNTVNEKEASKDGTESWRFTYALMTGVSYDLSSSIKLDLGYRFSQVSSGDMFDFSDYEQVSGAFGTKGKDKGFARHEFRAGLRVVGW